MRYFHDLLTENLSLLTSALLMEAVCSSAMLAHHQETTKCNNPKDHQKYP
jgi:hypothetical protein